jgi:hypothetical protein
MTISKISFIEASVATVVVACVVVPMALWAFESGKSGKLVDFPSTMTGFMSAATALTLAVLGIQQFTINKTS